jgi:hypothetical protein
MDAPVAFAMNRSLASVAKSTPSSASRRRIGTGTAPFSASSRVS